MADGKLVGVDLSIDHNYLSSVVREVALTTISEAIDKKNAVVEAIVNEVMKQKVDRYGKPAGRYASNDSMTILEFYVKEMLTEEVRKQVKEMIEERREDISAMIHDVLHSEETMKSFTDAFTDSVEGALNNSWYPSLKVTFEKRED